MVLIQDNNNKRKTKLSIWDDFHFWKCDLQCETILINTRFQITIRLGMTKNWKIKSTKYFTDILLNLKSTENFGNIYIYITQSSMSVCLCMFIFTFFIYFTFCMYYFREIHHFLKVRLWSTILVSINQKKGRKTTSSALGSERYPSFCCLARITPLLFFCLFPKSRQEHLKQFRLR